MTLKVHELLNNARLNKGTAFTLEEREALGLSGLLPPHVSTMKEQVERALSSIRRKESDIDRYIFLSALQKRNERLYYRLLIDHTKELMPLVYTPTVGQACLEFASIFRETSGFYLSYADKGLIQKRLANWPEQDVRLIVVTDGERILGLGDLGANGMGIPIGKLALYCACAGVKPEQCLPIMLDLGTNNESIRNDPLYLGVPEPRKRGSEYDDFLEEFVRAVEKQFPNALLQFEDFATGNAVNLLEKYRDQLLCFNDDIQGTASVVLAGLMATTRISKIPLQEQRFLFLGAGSAATGIGHLLTTALEREGITTDEARARLFFIDRKGLVTQCRDDLPGHVAPFAANMPPMNLKQAIDTIKPNALIGASGTAGVFTEEIIRTVASCHRNPTIFALSNPTSKAECTAEDAYKFSDGRAIFASGSPFGVVHINGEIKVPGQGNNAYIFPGLGLGAIHGKITRITDDQLITAAQELAGSVSDKQIQHGCLYPPLDEIRNVSVKIAAAVARDAERAGLTSEPVPENFEELLTAELYDPLY